MKILVLQVKLYNSNGYSYAKFGAEDFSDETFEKLLRDSVIRYCNKYSYDYQLVEAIPEGLNVDWFVDPLIPEKRLKSALVRYQYFYNENYDAVVSLDNDIYINANAEPLPAIAGHMGVSDTLERIYERDSNLCFKRFFHKIDFNNLGFVNGGVQMVDTETGLMMQKYFKQICDNQVPPLEGYYSDQNYMNYFRSKFPDRSRLLENKWNFLVSRYEYTDYNNINFIHYSGIDGRNIYIKDRKNGLIE